MARFLVGLTGGLASGKSTVARRFAAAGWTVVDADRLVDELYRPGAEGSDEVLRLFGPEYLTADGAVDQAAVARRVFADPADRLRLEAAIHPLVRRRFAELARAAPGIVALEATLLVEAGYAPDFDAVVTVEAPRALRAARAAARGLAPEQAAARLAAQPDGAARRAAATHVLRNDDSRAALAAAADRLVAELERAAAERPRPGP